MPAPIYFATRLQWNIAWDPYEIGENNSDASIGIGTLERYFEEQQNRLWSKIIEKTGLRVSMLLDSLGKGVVGDKYTLALGLWWGSFWDLHDPSRFWCDTRNSLFLFYGERVISILWMEESENDKNDVQIRQIQGIRYENSKWKLWTRYLPGNWREGLVLMAERFGEKLGYGSVSILPSWRNDAVLHNLGTNLPVSQRQKLFHSYDQLAMDMGYKAEMGARPMDKSHHRILQYRRDLWKGNWRNFMHQ